MATRSSTKRQHSQTASRDVYEFRRKALGKGLLKGGGMVLAGLLFVGVLLLRLDLDLDRTWLAVLELAAPAPFLVGAGVYYWLKASKDDAIHYRFQKTPELPLAQVHDHDDAWLEGVLRCPQPLISPGIPKTCCWYHVVVEEKVYTSRTHYNWKVVRDTTRGKSIWITDRRREIEIDTMKAIVDYPIVVRRTSGNTRTTLRYLRPHGSVSACGLARYRRDVLGEHKSEQQDAALAQWIEKHKASQDYEEQDDKPKTRQERLREAGRAIRARKKSERRRIGIPHSAWHLESLDQQHGVPDEKRLMLTKSRLLPLLVTPLRRPEWHDRSEADELTSRAVADALFAYGIPASTWALGAYLGWWDTWAWTGLLIGLLVMLSLVMPARVIQLYNQFINYRQRMRAAVADLDADFATRHDLVPQLVAVVERACRHEQDVQALVAGIRRGGDGDDPGRAVIATREAHPELGTDPQFASLSRDVIALEEKIAFGRAHVLDTVTDYNTLVQRFPNVLLSTLTGFRSAPLPNLD